MLRQIRLCADGAPTSGATERGQRKRRPEAEAGLRVGLQALFSSEALARLPATLKPT